MDFVGIYGIVHLPTGYIYIGSSMNVLARSSWHLQELRRGRHHNKQLQQRFNLGDPEDFYVMILQRTSKRKEELLWALEQTWIQKFGYKSLNARPAGKMPGYKHLPDTIAKMSRSAIKVGKNPKLRRSRSLHMKAAWRDGRMNHAQ